MNAVPITKNTDTTTPTGRFRAELGALEQRYVERWERITPETPRLGEPVSAYRRWSNARAGRRLIDRLAREIDNHPEDERQRPDWRRRVEEEMRAFGERRFGWPAGYRRLLFADSYYESSVAFSRRARDFNPDLAPAEIGQAIRNVWIMNSLQMLLDQPVELTPAIFAYSMLYPETDNYLDDPAVIGGEKRRFNELLARRLRGEPLLGDDPRRQRVFRLVGMIEDQWSRSADPEVFESLLAIHRGQVESLVQHDPETRLSRRELIALSAAKGGASVLADGYLTAGRLTPEEADFCFGYGVFLQLLDDLQDRESDRAAGHATVFSVAPSGEALDQLACRLFTFMRRVVGRAARFSAPHYRDRKDLILRNCTLLFVAAVAEQRAAFSRPFRRRLERRWPLRLAAMPRLQRRADRRFRRALDDLCRRRGAESAFDLL